MFLDQFDLSDQHDLNEMYDQHDLNDLNEMYDLNDQHEPMVQTERMV